MATSARNVFSGKITSVTEGPIHAEVELTTTGGDKVVAVVTEGSVKSLGLSVGTDAKAFVKAPWVMVLKGEEGVKFTARNHLSGKVTGIKLGAINSDVTVTLPGGTDSKVTNITDVAFDGERVFATGTCNEEFASRIFTIPVPVKHGSTAGVISAASNTENVNDDGIGGSGLHYDSRYSPPPAAQASSVINHGDTTASGGQPA